MVQSLLHLYSMTVYGQINRLMHGFGEKMTIGRHVTVFSFSYQFDLPKRVHLPKICRLICSTAYARSIRSSFQTDPKFCETRYEILWKLSFLQINIYLRDQKLLLQSRRMSKKIMEINFWRVLSNRKWRATSSRKKVFFCFSPTFWFYFIHTRARK